MPPHLSIQVDYEQKIEASRDHGFLESLLDGQKMSSQVRDDNYQSNRYMSPSIRLQSREVPKQNKNQHVHTMNLGIDLNMSNMNDFNLNSCQVMIQNHLHNNHYKQEAKEEEKDYKHE